MHTETKQYGDALFSVPATWKDRSVVNFVGPADAGVATNLVVTQAVLAAPLSPDSYARHQRTALEESGLPGLQMGDIEPFTWGERRMYKLSYGWLAGDAGAQRRVRQEQFYLLDGHRALTLTFTCAEQSFPAMRQSFAEMVANVRFTDEHKE